MFVGKAENLSKKMTILYGEGELHEACQGTVLWIVHGREVNYLRDKYFVISWQKDQEWVFEINALSPAFKCFHVLLLAAT
jgi:hypothetical protein